MPSANTYLQTSNIDLQYKNLHKFTLFYLLTSAPYEINIGMLSSASELQAI